MHDHNQSSGGRHADGHEHDHRHAPHAPGGPGHNRPAAQWQVPHLPEGTAAEDPPPVQDLDLVETSFIEGFGQASDPTSFLRLAGIPFVGVDPTGRRLHLLRVELEELTDVGAVAPLLGNEGVRYDPLPLRMVSRRRKLAFVYHDGRQVTRLDFAAARGLADQSAASRFSVPSDERS